MQSLLIACLTFAHIPEDPMPVAAGTSPSNSSSELSITFQLALIRLTLLRPSKAFHDGILLSQQARGHLKNEMPPSYLPQAPSVTVAVALQQAWLTLGAAYGIAVPGAWTCQAIPRGDSSSPGRPRMQGWPCPTGYTSFFSQLPGEEPCAKTQCIHTGFCCPLACPESSSSP